MKIKLQGKIQRMSRRNDDGLVDLLLVLNGNVENSRSPDAKKATMEATLTVKSLVVNNLQLGSNITVILSDEVVE
jgi:hypothetical protein